jgi:ribose transport system permease protein
MLKFRQMMFSLSRVMALLVLCVVVAIVAPAFLAPQNLVNVLRQASLMIILSTGLTAVLLTGGIDLSIASLLALSGCFSGMLMTGGTPWYLAALGGVGVATLCGVVNGLMVAVVRLPPFIATYGMMWIAQGLAILVARSEVFYNFPAPFLLIGRGDLLGVPMPIILMVLVVAAAWALLNRTPFGREVYAMGANPAAAKLSGIDLRNNLLLIYTVSGFLSGFAGTVMIARMNAASAEISADQLLPAVAAVVIGGTSLFGGEGGIRGTVVGALIMTVLINGMNLLNISPFWQLTAQGGLVIVAVLLDQWARSVEARSEKKRTTRKIRPGMEAGPGATVGAEPGAMVSG